MLVNVEVIATGRPKPIVFERTGDTMYFLEAVCFNPDGSSEKIKFRSYSINFSDIPLKQTIALSGEVKLYSKDNGKTTVLEFQSIGFKPVKAA